MSRCDTATCGACPRCHAVTHLNTRPTPSLRTRAGVAAANTVAVVFMAGLTVFDKGLGLAIDLGLIRFANDTDRGDQ